MSVGLAAAGLCSGLPLDTACVAVELARPREA
jgi:hypothetical protein